MMWRYLSDGLDLFSKKGMCAQIVFGVERGGKFFGFDGFAAAGGVDEFAVADVEADMGIFVCAASSGKTIKTEKLSTPFYAKNYLGAHTFFTE